MPEDPTPACYAHAEPAAASAAGGNDPGEEADDNAVD